MITIVQSIEQCLISVISTVLIIHVAEVTKLNSIPEMTCFLLKGRGPLIYILVLQMCYFSTLPLTFFQEANILLVLLANYYFEKDQIN